MRSTNPVRFSAECDVTVFAGWLASDRANNPVENKETEREDTLVRHNA